MGREPPSTSSTSSGPNISSRVVFTRRAEADLAAIFDWSCARFSRDQARHYVDGLEACVDRLLQFPDSAPRYAGLGGRYRVKRYRSHRIYYRQASDSLMVVRILHVRRNAATELG